MQLIEYNCCQDSSTVQIQAVRFEPGFSAVPCLPVQSMMGVAGGGGGGGRTQRQKPFHGQRPVFILIFQSIMGGGGGGGGERKQRQKLFPEQRPVNSEK